MLAGGCYCSAHPGQAARLGTDARVRARARARVAEARLRYGTGTRASSKGLGVVRSGAGGPVSTAGPGRSRRVAGRMDRDPTRFLASPLCPAEARNDFDERLRRLQT